MVAACVLHEDSVFSSSGSVGSFTVSRCGASRTMVCIDNQWWWWWWWIKI
jgi:hypothetical protein